MRLDRERCMSLDVFAAAHFWRLLENLPVWVFFFPMDFWNQIQAIRVAEQAVDLLYHLAGFLDTF